MNNKDIIELVIAVITGVATILATYLSYKAIKQTEKNSVIVSNQFLFDRRLEIINYFKAIISLSKNKGIHVTELTKYTRENAEDPLSKVSDTVEQLTNILYMQFSSFVNNLYFYELNSMIVEVREGSSKVYDKERVKCIVFVEEMLIKIESVDYLFSDVDLKVSFKTVLEGYLSILKKYNVLFYELHNIKFPQDFAVLFITYDELKKEVDELKSILVDLDIEEFKIDIQKELAVF